MIFPAHEAYVMRTNNSDLGDVALEVAVSAVGNTYL